MRARLGPKSAIVATAHKMARMVYHMLTHHTLFRALSPEEDTQQTRAWEIVAVCKKAACLDLTLVESLA